MAVVNDGKKTILREVLQNPQAHCKTEDIDLDFLDELKVLSSELATTSFDPKAPSIFLSEGLIMYLGNVGKVKLIKDLSEVAASGSMLVLQFMDASESESAKANPAALDAALSQKEATDELTKNGWGNLQFSKFGDDQLNFGRFPTDKFVPQATFSFCVCTKK